MTLYCLTDQKNGTVGQSLTPILCMVTLRCPFQKLLLSNCGLSHVNTDLSSGVEKDIYQEDTGMWQITITQLLQVEGKRTWHLHTPTAKDGQRRNHLLCRKLTCVAAFAAICTSSLWHFVQRCIVCLCFSCSQVAAVLGSGDFSSCPGLKAGLHFGQVTSLTCSVPMQKDKQPSSCQSIDCACLWIV